MHQDDEACHGSLSAASTAATSAAQSPYAPALGRFCRFIADRALESPLTCIPCDAGAQSRTGQVGGGGLSVSAHEVSRYRGFVLSIERCCGNRSGRPSAPPRSRVGRSRYAQRLGNAASGVAFSSQRVRDLGLGHCGAIQERILGRAPVELRFDDKSDAVIVGPTGSATYLTHSELVSAHS